MSLSPTERLKKHNASAPAGEIGRDTLSLFHPSFSQDWHLTTWYESFIGNVRGMSVTFEPYPFTVRLPADSTQGRFDIDTDFFNDGQTFIQELKAAAADPTIRPEMEYNIYLDPYTDSEINALVTQIMAVSFTSSSATVRSTRPNIQNRRFPSQVYLPDRFPGLVR